MCSLIVQVRVKNLKFSKKNIILFFYSFIYDFILSGIMVVIMDARACSHSAHAPGDNLARTGEDQTNHAILYENFILFYL